MTAGAGNGRPTGAGQAWGDGALLPEWLAARLGAGPARFGILLVTGHVVVIDAVRHVRQSPAGQVWIDVELLIPFKKDGFPWGHFPLVKRTSEDRAAGSINAAHVVALVEVDTWEVPPLQPGIE